MHDPRTGALIGRIDALLARAATNDPATLIGFYPGLIVATVTNVGVVVTTNLTAFYTNFPGPDVTNFLPTFSTNGTSDIGLLLARAATNDPTLAGQATAPHRGVHAVFDGCCAGPAIGDAAGRAALCAPYDMR